MDKPEYIRNREHKHGKISYNRIDELIYAGNNFCCLTHFKKELLLKGIRADISFELERLDNPQGVDYFFWFPWEEDTAPKRKLVNIAFGVLDHLMENKVKTYIHCKNGHGRTSTFLAAYFIYKKGLNADEALELVRAKRPSMHINQVQKAFLKEYSLSLKK